MLLFVALVGIVSGAAAEPTLQAPAGAVRVGDAAAFTLRPQSGSPVAVDGCVALELERRVGERWVPVSSEVRCDGAEAARKIAKELGLSVPVATAGEYRGVLAWGAGCVEGRPFALAACSSRGVATSKVFTVSEGSEKP